jgi:CRP-like cAMP-binding protein
LQQEIGLSNTISKSESNQLIAGLPRNESRSLLQLCEPVDLTFGTELCEVQTPLQHAYFPLSGWISLISATSNHHPLGVAMIGNEGVLGASLALGVSNPRLRGVVHGPGVGLRTTASQLRRLLRNSPALQNALRCYVHVLMGQLIQTATCNSFHEVEMRLARWLLMTQDRASSELLPLTHQLLADLLGVQRSAVTIAAGKLQRKKLIGYSRGQIRILSRNGLEDACCECYGVQIRDHALKLAG